MRRKTRYYVKYSAQYLVFPASIHVTSRKIDYLWNSAPATTNHLCLYFFSNIKLVKIYLCCTARLFSFFCQHIVKRHKTQDLFFSKNQGTDLIVVKQQQVENLLLLGK